jgi:hypothetical protein
MTVTMTITIIQGLWKEGSKEKKLYYESASGHRAQGYERKAAIKFFYCERACDHRAVKGRQQHKNLLWRCLWPRGALKFQIAFWALKLTSTNKINKVP